MSALAIAFCYYLAGTVDYKMWGCAGFVILFVFFIVGGIIDGRKYNK